MGMGMFGHRFNIDDAQGWVCRGFDPNQLPDKLVKIPLEYSHPALQWRDFYEDAYLGVWSEMRLNIISIGQVNKSSIDTITNGHLGEVTVSSAIDIVDGDNM
jgi:hypothetical protein